MRAELPHSLDQPRRAGYHKLATERFALRGVGGDTEPYKETQWLNPSCVFRCKRWDGFHFFKIKTLIFVIHV
jgi:hypothetical protein